MNFVNQNPLGLRLTMRGRDKHSNIDIWCIIFKSLHNIFQVNKLKLVVTLKLRQASFVPISGAGSGGGAGQPSPANRVHSLCYQITMGNSIFACGDIFKRNQPRRLQRHVPIAVSVRNNRPHILLTNTGHWELTEIATVLFIN